MFIEMGMIVVKNFLSLGVFIIGVFYFFRFLWGYDSMVMESE